MTDEQFTLFDDQPLRIRNDIYLIELFAGIGSQYAALRNLKDKGVIKQNVIPWRVVEFDRFAMASYNAVHGTSFTPTDIKTVRGGDLGITDTKNRTYIMTYSFPCQQRDISNAGKQRGFKKGENTRSGLLWEVERILKEINDSDEYELPNILLCENVPAIVSKKNRPDLEQWMEFLHSLGYMSKWQLLNAKDFGIPQNRERFFMVSWLEQDKDYQFPKPFPLKIRLKDVLEKTVDEKFYLSEKAVRNLLKQIEKPHKPTLIDEDAVERERERDCDGADSDRKLLEDSSMGSLHFLNDLNGCSHTIRVGGRGDVHAKHSWDLIGEEHDSE